MVLLGGLGFAVLSGQQTPRVSVQSPSSVEQSTPQKSSTTVSLVPPESTVVTVVAPIVPTTAEQPAPDTTDEVGDGGESTETVQGGGTVAKRPSTTLAGSRPTTTTARPGTSASPPTSTAAPTTTAAEAIRTGSCRGGAITVRISPSLALLSARPTAGFTIVENEIQDDEVKVKFSDGHYECAVRIRSDGRVQYDG